MQICSVEAQFFIADRWTDGRTDRREKLIVVFRNFANAPRYSIQLVTVTALVDVPLSSDRNYYY